MTQSSLPEPRDSLELRAVIDSDLPIFFEHMQDAEAIHMAAFTPKDPADREKFDAHWVRIQANPTVMNRTIVFNGQVAGSVVSYEEDGLPEVSYWLGREFWGQGIASRALAEFLDQHQRQRPIRARVAKDNLPSLRVLEKCGFVITGEDKGFANARGCETEEWVLELRAA
jgi:RimJ/RimL family protein N-acetyltransferase